MNLYPNLAKPIQIGTQIVKNSQSFKPSCFFAKNKSCFCAPAQYSPVLLYFFKKISPLFFIMAKM